MKEIFRAQALFSVDPGLVVMRPRTQSSKTSNERIWRGGRMEERARTMISLRAVQIDIGDVAQVRMVLPAIEIGSGTWIVIVRKQDMEMWPDEERDSEVPGDGDQRAMGSGAEVIEGLGRGTNIRILAFESGTP